MRCPLIATIIVSLVGNPSLRAEEPSARSSSQRKAAIEKALDSPLNWELADRQHVTLGELIEHVQQEHHLRVRWDAGSLRLTFGDQAPFAELVGTPLARLEPVYASCQPVAVATHSATIPSSSLQPATSPYPSSPYPSFDPYHQASSQSVRGTFRANCWADSICRAVDGRTRDTRFNAWTVRGCRGQ